MDGIILVDKTQNMTSFDVIRELRRKYRLKLGHSGTLDPNATGLLLIASGKATKALNFITAHDKVYTATCKLGIKTDTGDIWGNTLLEKEPEKLTQDKILKILSCFIGKQKQRVPMVSAKKIDGKKLYEYHRENIKVETQYTEIEIYDLKLLSLTDNTFTFEAHVSNGTYIRTLCEDIAEALNEIGTMSALRRTKIGDFDVKDAISLDSLPETLTLIPTKDVITLQTIYDPDLEFKIKNGHRIQHKIKDDRVLFDAGEYFAVYQREKDDIFKSVRGLW